MRYVVPGLLGVCLCAAVILFGAVELHHATIVYGLAALLALIWAGNLFFSKTAFWKPSPMHWPVLGFVLYTFIHYFFISPYEYLTRLELFQVALCGLIYFIVANNINHGRDRMVVVSILLVLGTLEAMYGIWQAYTKSHFVLNVYRPSGFYLRASGTYICPNHLAGLLEMIMGFALARLALYRLPDRESIERQVLSKVMLAYAVIVMIVGILFTLSRGGWAATAAGLMVFLVWGGLRGRTLWPRIAAGVAALSVLGLVLFSVPRVRHYLELTLSGQKEGAVVPLKDASMKGRTMLWGATWKMIQDYPVLGSGAGTWQWFHPKYRHPQMQFAADYAHNDILQMTSDYGVVGFALVVGVLGCFFWQARRMTLYGVTSEQRCFAVGAVLAVSTLVFHSWFDFNLHIPANGLLFCTILGLVAGMEVPDGPYLPRPLKSPFRYLIGAVVVGMVALGACFIVPAARAVRYTELGNIEKTRLYWDEAIEYYKIAIRLDPKYIRPRTKIGDIYTTQAQFRLGEDKKQERIELAQKAIEHYTAAFQLNPARADVLARLAAAYEQADDFEKARATFEKALSMDPKNLGIHSQFALFLRRRGNEAEALRQFEVVASLHASKFTDFNIEELRQSVRAD